MPIAALPINNTVTCKAIHFYQVVFSFYNKVTY